MSEQNVKSSSRSGVRRHRDAGFTLPELLVSIIVLGSIVAVLSSAIIVTFKQRDDTEGRLNVSRAEQAIDTWIPADLASAGSVPSAEPWMSPCSLNLVPGTLDTSDCPTNVDLSGSNALFLSWTSQDLTLVTTTTQVSYHFTQRAGGLFDLVRIECNARDSGPSTALGPWTCGSITILHDLPGPPPPAVFDPGVTAPFWVLTVSVPLAPEPVGGVPGPTTTYLNSKNAKQVVVTITGGGDVSGSGGGINRISITAGGTSRGTLDVKGGANAPSFTTIKSRCGGPLTLIVDESGSIGDLAMVDVRGGVAAFVESLRGTPVQIQVVRFDTTASVLGSSAWSNYYDMLDTDRVDDLIADIAGLDTKSYTNWEDAWFRTFYDKDGGFNPIIPQTVVFFTDGIPSWDRTANRGSPGVLNPTGGPTAPNQTHSGGWPALDTDGWKDFNQVAFHRAENWIQQFRGTDTRLIGVGVGPSIGSLSESSPTFSDVHRDGLPTDVGYPASLWLNAPPTATSLVWEQGSRTYQRAGSFGTRRARWWTRPVASGPYNTPVTQAEHDAVAGNLNWDYGTNSSSWASINSTQFASKNSTVDNSDGFMRSSPGGWQWVTTAEYQSKEPKDADAYRSQTTQYVSSGPDWLPSGSGTTSDYRSWSGTPTWNAEILSQFITGGAGAIEWDGTNEKDANLYISPNWSEFDDVMTAVALGECGATLTFQTKKQNGTPETQAFEYGNTALTGSDGVTSLFSERTNVTTSNTVPAVTFDLNITDGTARYITFVPSDLHGSAYTGGTWSCKVGIDDRTPELIASTDGSPWTGIKVRIEPNEAVSCIHTVTAAP